MPNKRKRQRPRRTFRQPPHLRPWVWTHPEGELASLILATDRRDCEREVRKRLREMGMTPKEIKAHLEACELRETEGDFTISDDHGSVLITLDPPINRLQMRICAEQERVIRKRYGDEAADSANYGWGVSDGDDFLSVATKVYSTRDGTMVLTSEAALTDRQIQHEWRSY